MTQLNSVFNALSSHLDILVQPKADFLQIVTPVLNALTETLSLPRADAQLTFQLLNRRRVNFKHYGELPETASSFHLVEQTVDFLNLLTRSATGVSLLEIDNSDAIQWTIPREHFAQARTFIIEGRYREALESIGLAITEVYRDSLFALPIESGVPDSQSALLLSGRQIDPSAFLMMQQLLPKVDWSDLTVDWNLRERGHPANWNERNARLCLETAISIVAKLQFAKAEPTPLEFYSVYEDVLTVQVEKPEVFKSEWTLFDGASPQERFEGFQKGDAIGCHASGFFDREKGIKQGLDDAEWICATRVESIRISELATVELWFRRAEVQLGYRESSYWKALRAHRSHDSLKGDA